MSVTTFFVLLCSLIIISTPLNLNCTYNKNADWWIVKFVYQCDIKSYISVQTPQESLIYSINGNHLLYHGNNDVKGFVIQKLVVQFFPTQLDKFFKNLELIHISHCNLKEVHQTHVKPFPKLRAIVLHDNDIEVIENGLFDYNLNLEIVWLNKNKLIHIGMNVFDDLNKLTYLNLEDCNCISMHAKNNTIEVKQIIKISKEKCQVRSIKSLLETIKNLTEKLTDFQSIDKSIMHHPKNEENKERSLSPQITAEISEECNEWKSIRFGILILSGVVYNLIILLILILFY